MDEWSAALPPPAFGPSSTRNCWPPASGSAPTCSMRWWRSERYVPDHCHRGLGMRARAVVAFFQCFSPFRYGPAKEPAAPPPQVEKDQSGRSECVADSDRREQRAVVDEVSKTLSAP